MLTITMLYVQIMITALFLAVACIVPGLWLQLNNRTLISDAMSHAILLGIVLTFFITHSLHSTWFFIGATITAIITLLIIDSIIYHKKLHKDAAIGICFPALFAVATLLINTHTQSIHLDLDAILLGELAFTPLYQIVINQTAYGSYALYVTGIIMIINWTMQTIMYRSLKVSSFDTTLAYSLGFKEQFQRWVLNIISVITMIAAFECAGVMLVIAFMIIPIATARLIVYNIKQIIALSVLITVSNTMVGCLLAYQTNTAIAPALSTAHAITFIATLIILKITKN